MKLNDGYFISNSKLYLIGIIFLSFAFGCKSSKRAPTPEFQPTILKDCTDTFLTVAGDSFYQTPDDVDNECEGILIPGSTSGWVDWNSFPGGGFFHYSCQNSLGEPTVCWCTDLILSNSNVLPLTTVFGRDGAAACSLAAYPNNLGDPIPTTFVCWAFEQDNICKFQAASGNPA